MRSRISIVFTIMLKIETRETHRRGTDIIRQNVCYLCHKDIWGDFKISDHELICSLVRTHSIFYNFSQNLNDDFL